MTPDGSIEAPEVLDDDTLEDATGGIIGVLVGVTSRQEAATGLPTGKRGHAPLSVTKPVDKATFKDVGPTRSSTGL